MIIEEKDFKIICEHKNYTLYLIKGKKELKEDSEDKFKVGGYFMNVENALKAVIRFRRDKKYPGKEDSESLWIPIKDLVYTQIDFDQLILSIYNPILDLKHKLKI